MPLLGKAVVAMWWDVIPAQRPEFEDWHSHEHFRERLSIPGFLRASRWAIASGGDAFFVMYELAAVETLASKHYLARLDNPTPWSVRMMPHHRNMVRSLCAITLTYGGGIPRSMATVRLSPRAGEARALLDGLREMLPKAPELPGMTGAHLLQTQARKPVMPMTAEQRIRGGDAAADWILLFGGYDSQGLAEFVSSPLNAKALVAAGAQPESVSALYDLRYAMTSLDL
jgi:hypothetical protein